MIILASASPRRKELLALLTTQFKVVPSHADEHTDLKDAQEVVRFLACKKARDVAAAYPQDTIIGADTVVEAGGEILEKPKDKADARRMIALLQGNQHMVYTGICVIKDNVEHSEVCATKVCFSPMSEQEIDRYIATEDVMDKAGAYAIQGGAAKFITGIEGDFFNVVGLPVGILYQMLNRV
ncbi:Maf family protein [Christensenellaceae bacterium OttesenSCG-928-K19]|nr:Maf family protein [Christensenellaceae bacterium OttesenSCG-928-K19]